MANTRVSGAQVQITGTLDMRGNVITGLESDVNVYPNASDDGATKAYVDYQRQLIEADLPTLANNGTY
jgi:hypothetical protein